MGERARQIDDLFRKPARPSLGVNTVLMKPPSYNRFCHGEELTSSDAEFPVKRSDERKTKNYSICPNRSPRLKDRFFLTLPDKNVPASQR